MAVVRNITPDTLGLRLAGGSSVRKGDHADVPDVEFAGRAWPRSTWALVKKPAKDKYADHSTDDAYLFLPTTPAVEADKEKS